MQGLKAYIYKLSYRIELAFIVSNILLVLIGKYVVGLSDAYLFIILICNILLAHESCSIRSSLKANSYYPAILIFKKSFKSRNNAYIIKEIENKIIEEKIDIVLNTLGEYIIDSKKEDISLEDLIDIEKIVKRFSDNQAIYESMMEIIKTYEK